MPSIKEKEPWPDLGTIAEPAREVKVLRRSEVVVAGGGLTGACAAVASARNGAKTTLIERYGYLGGMASGGWVEKFDPFDNYGDPVIAGLAQEVVDRLAQKGGMIKKFYDLRNFFPQYAEQHNWDALFGEYCGAPRYCTIFDPETMKFVLDDMVREAGVDLLLHTWASDAVVDGTAIKGVFVQSKSGRLAVMGDVIVDTSADGDVAASAGAPFDIGRPRDRLMMPPTLYYRMVNVDIERARSFQQTNKGFEDLIKEARARGELVHFPRDFFGFGTGPRKGVVYFNATRVLGIDGTDVRDLTYAELCARDQIAELVAFLRKYVPGFEEAELLDSAPQMGVRETRRIIGEYIITEDDVVNGKHFADAIARGVTHIDVHDPDGGGFDVRPLKPLTWHDIPYRALVPLKIENLLVAGRCVSADHIAHSSVRFMQNCMPMGQAAGTAAALSVKQGLAPRRLDVSQLQRTLVNQGASLALAPIPVPRAT